MNEALADLLEAFPPLGPWVAEAACGDLMAPDVFTAERRPAEDELALAERVCRRCPVVADCRAYAAVAPVHGFWAGVWHSGWGKVADAA